VPAHQRTPFPDPLTLLASGGIEIQGRMPWSSNGTFLVTVRPPVADGASPAEPQTEPQTEPQNEPQTETEAPAGTEGLVAIYKPLRAERPLWDFPDGLYRREVAAYELDRALGWGLVPETIVRRVAPLDVGSLQRFVEADFEQHYFTLLEDETHHGALRRMAAFDVVANNADRKGGHCLIDGDGSIWGIDHGLCFHTEPKLRTVIWDFAGEPLADETVADLRRFLDDDFPPALAALLHEDEQRALVKRARALVHRPTLPQPRSDRAYPWPLV
jgi:uncharacterized repeat protein (TIGR03843 family)